MGNKIERRKAFLINPAFQIKFGLFITILLMAICLIYPFAIMQIFDHFILLLQRIHFPSVGQYSHNRGHIIFALIILQIGVAVSVFIIGIIYGHKIAGPISRAQNHLFRVRNGDQNISLDFRKGDYFNELAVEINNLLQQFAQIQNQNRRFVEEIEKNIDLMTSGKKEDQAVYYQKIKTNLISFQHNNTKF